MGTTLKSRKTLAQANHARMLRNSFDCGECNHQQQLYPIAHYWAQKPITKRTLDKATVLFALLAGLCAAIRLYF